MYANVHVLWNAWSNCDWVDVCLKFTGLLNLTETLFLSGHQVSEETWHSRLTWVLSLCLLTHRADRPKIYAGWQVTEHWIGRPGWVKTALDDSGVGQSGDLFAILSCAEGERRTGVRLSPFTPSPVPPFSTLVSRSPHFSPLVKVTCFLQHFSCLVLQLDISFRWVSFLPDFSCCTLSEILREAVSFLLFFLKRGCWCYNMKINVNFELG